MRTLETNGLLSRILADQKGMEYVQSNKRIKMLSTNNTVSGKPVFKNELEIEIIPGKQKLSVFSPLDLFITVEEKFSGTSTRTLDGK